MKTAKYTRKPSLIAQNNIILHTEFNTEIKERKSNHIITRNISQTESQKTFIYTLLIEFLLTTENEYRNKNLLYFIKLFQYFSQN